MGEKETTRSAGAGQETEIVSREAGDEGEQSARTSNLNLSKSNINREAGGGGGAGGDSEAAIKLNSSKSNAN